MNTQAALTCVDAEIVINLWSFAMIAVSKRVCRVIGEATIHTRGKKFVLHVVVLGSRCVGSVGIGM